MKSRKNPSITTASETVFNAEGGIVVPPKKKESTEGQNLRASARKFIAGNVGAVTLFAGAGLGLVGYTAGFLAHDRSERPTEEDVSDSDNSRHEQLRIKDSEGYVYVHVDPETGQETIIVDPTPIDGQNSKTPVTTIEPPATVPDYGVNDEMVERPDRDESNPTTTEYVPYATPITEDLINHGVPYIDLGESTLEPLMKNPTTTIAEPTTLQP